MEQNAPIHKIKEGINKLITGDANTDFIVKNNGDNEEDMLRSNLKRQNYFSIGHLSLFIVLGGVSVISILFKSFINVVKIRNLIFLIIAIVGFVLLRKSGKMRAKNKEQYDRLIVEKAVQEFLPDASIQPAIGINADQLYRLGVVPLFNHEKGSYLLQFNKDGQQCYISNLTLEYETESQESTGTIKTVFDGQAYILSYETQISGHVRIMSTYKTKIMNTEKLAGYRKITENEYKVEVENQVFNEQFDVYATDEESAFSVLTPYVMEQLLMMRKKYGHFGMAVNGNKIAIALNSNYKLFAIPYEYNKIDQVSVENSINELRNILNFAHSIENSINGQIKKG